MSSKSWSASWRQWWLLRRSETPSLARRRTKRFCCIREVVKIRKKGCRSLGIPNLWCWSTPIAFFRKPLLCQATLCAPPFRPRWIQLTTFHVAAVSLWSSRSSVWGVQRSEADVGKSKRTSWWRTTFWGDPPYQRYIWTTGGLCLFVYQNSSSLWRGWLWASLRINRWRIRSPTPRSRAQSFQTLSY